MTLNIGEQAPDFSLKTKNAEGLKDVSLSDHKDQQAVVLLFFPFPVKSERASFLFIDFPVMLILSARHK